MEGILVYQLQARRHVRFILGRFGPFEITFDISMARIRGYKLHNRLFRINAKSEEGKEVGMRQSFPNFELASEGLVVDSGSERSLQTMLQTHDFYAEATFRVPAR